MLTYTASHSHTHSLTLVLSHTHALMCPHTCLFMPSNTHQTYTYTYAHTQTNTYVHTYSLFCTQMLIDILLFIHENTYTHTPLSLILPHSCTHVCPQWLKNQHKNKRTIEGHGGGGRQKGKEVRTYKQQAKAMLPERNCSGIKGTRERTRAEGSLAKPCTSHGGRSGRSCSPSSYEVDGLLLTCCVHGANHFAPLPQYPVMVCEPMASISWAQTLLAWLP